MDDNRIRIDLVIESAKDLAKEYEDRIKELRRKGFTALVGDLEKKQAEFSYTAKALRYFSKLPVERWPDKFVQRFRPITEEWKP